MIIHVLTDSSGSLSIIDIIEDYYSLTWAERYSEVGDFELELPIKYASSSSIAFDNFLYIADSDKLMVIEDIKPFYGEDKIGILIKGESSETLLKRRVLLEELDIDDTAEAVVYQLVADNVTEPVDTDREIAIFDTTFPTTSIPTTIQSQLEIQSVYSAVEMICKSTDLGFKIVEDSDKLAFSVYEGEDRSYDQSINPYVVFSDDFDNVIASSFYESKKDKINVVLVCTDDSVETLQKILVWAAGESEPSGLTRYENFLETSIDRDLHDQQSLEDADVLVIINARGRTLIKERETVGLFEGDFDIQGNFKYGTDFFMGDIVQCKLEGKNVKARIIELVRSYSTEGETSYVAMNFIT